MHTVSYKWRFSELNRFKYHILSFTLFFCFVGIETAIYSLVCIILLLWEMHHIKKELTESEFQLYEKLRLLSAELMLALVLSGVVLSLDEAEEEEKPGSGLRHFLPSTVEQVQRP